MKIEPTFASQMYGNATQMLKPGADPADAMDSGFADALEAALRDLHNTVTTGERTAVSAMNGTGDVQSLAEALTATEMALETAVSIRDKVVEAYQEILRMPV